MTSLPAQPAVADLLARAETAILTPDQSARAPAIPGPQDRRLSVGVDLGTAYLVLVVLDEHGQPLVGEYQFAQVVRDGLVVDFVGAVDRLREMVARVSRRLGQPLNHAATGYPPGVPLVEVRATRNVLEAAGLACTSTVDEPSAANAILNLDSGVIVDVGGGTTGIAVVEHGQVVYTADEPTGGTHFTLVISGALNLPFEQAETLKTDPQEQPRLFPIIRPVMEKVASIVERHLQGRAVDQITLVGGASAYPGFANVVGEYTGISTRVPERPLFITPLGIARHDRQTVRPD